MPDPSRSAEGMLGYEDLRGRLVELTQDRGSAGLSFLCSRIREAQTLEEPVAWVRTGGSVFFAPDLAENGVDLSSLVVIRAPDSRGGLRAVHHLLHSGAFGLVALDLRDAPADLPGRRSLPDQGLLGRFARLAEKSGTALVCLTARGLGSLVSLRLRTRLHRVEPGLFRCDVEVVKDKRRGPGRRAQEMYDAPAGLR